jgi:serine/threonine protein kinase
LYQLRRLQYIHSCNLIHRDLKPSNIVIGAGEHANLVYIIDFGLSKEFRNPNTRAHIPYSHGHGFTGTAAFASVNSHLGLELGRRDDLESLAYILIYFLCGFLPWQDTKKDILTLKQGITSHNIFHELPVEFRTFLEACRSLAFHDKPNYDQYYNLFHDLLLRRGFESDRVFDWDC